MWEAIIFFSVVWGYGIGMVILAYISHRINK